MTNSEHPSKPMKPDSPEYRRFLRNFKRYYYQPTKTFAELLAIIRANRN